MIFAFLVVTFAYVFIKKATFIRKKTNRNLKIYKLILIVVLFLIGGVKLIAQPPAKPDISEETTQNDDTAKVRIIFSEKLIGRTDDGERVKRLIGNVQLEQNDVKMRCDSAVVIGNDVEAYGNVIIVQSDTVQIFADSLFYYGDARESILIGNVVLTDGKTKLFTDRLDYDLNTKIATYKSGAILENENTRLSSQRGYYYTEQNLAYFGGDVVVADPEFSLKADTLKVDTDKNISYFIGPTDILTKNDEQIYSEEGFYDPAFEYAEFSKRPRFRSDDGFAKAKKIRYVGAEDKILLEGEAYFKNDKQLAEADTIIYNTALKQFSSRGVTTIKEEGRQILADNSFYDDSLEVAIFVGNVCISDSNKIICADSIRYSEARKVGEAFGNVISRDTVENITLECEQLFYNDSTSYVLAFGRPLMTSVMNDDSLFLAADTLVTFSQDMINFSDSMQVLIAKEDVRIYKSDFQAVCDSLVYVSIDSIFQLFQDPVVWSDTSQFTADTINIVLKNDAIHKVHLKKKAFLINSTDEVYFNQIKGREIIANFKNDSIRTMNVNGNGETIYYIQDAEKAYITANKTLCSEMLITFQNNELQDILFYKMPEGKTFPMKKIKRNPIELEDFSWRIKERPRSKEDLRDLPVLIQLEVGN